MPEAPAATVTPPASTASTASAASPSPNSGGGGGAATAEPPDRAERNLVDQALDDTFAELDELDRTGALPQRRNAQGKFQPKAEVKAPPDATKPAEGEPKPDTGATKPADDPGKPVPAKQLREAYDQVKGKLKDYETQTATLQARVKELETAKPDTKALQDRLDNLTKERDTLLEEVRFVNYQKHPEFETKFTAPYKEAWARAVGEIVQLKVTNKDGTTRPATAEDFLMVANAPLNDLDALAEEMFGKSAARVVRHAEKVRELSEAQHKALETARKDATERATQQATASRAEGEKLVKVYNETTATLETKYPKWFKPDETDPEGNALLTKSSAKVEAVFDSASGLNQEQRTQGLARIKMQAKAFTRVASRLNKATARIAELEAQLAEYEKSGELGGPGERGGGGSTSFLEDANAELDRLNVK